MEDDKLVYESIIVNCLDPHQVYPSLLPLIKLNESVGGTIVI